MSHPIDVPVGTRSAVASRHADGSHARAPGSVIFVGSPEHTSQLDTMSVASHPTGRYNTMSRGTSNGASRPGFGRSISSSVVIPQRGPDAFSRMHDITASHSRRTHRGRRESREWSVFGQLYDTADDQPRAPRTTAARQSSRSQSVNGSTTHPRTVSSPQDTISASTGIQSPVDDSNMGNPFPNSRREGGALPSDVSQSDSDTTEELLTTRQSSRQNWYSFVRMPTLSPLHRNILKCAIAYLIGSLFTYSPYLSGFIADLTNYGPGESIPSPSGHMVATV